MLQFWFECLTPSLPQRFSVRLKVYLTNVTQFVNPSSSYFNHPSCGIYFSPCESTQPDDIRLTFFLGHDMAYHLWFHSVFFNTFILLLNFITQRQRKEVLLSLINKLSSYWNTTIFFKISKEYQRLFHKCFLRFSPSSSVTVQQRRWSWFKSTPFQESWLSIINLFLSVTT